MKAFLAVLALALVVLSPRAHGQEAVSAEDRYVKIYGYIRQGDRSAESGRVVAATTNYAAALAGLKKLQIDFPDFSPKVVKYRIEYVTAKLAPATPKAPPKAPAPVTNAPAAAPVKEAAVEKPATEAEATEAVEMKLKWMVGKRYLQRMELAQNTEATLPGQAQPFKQTMNMAQDIAITAVKEREGGGSELEMEIMGMALSMKLGDTTAMAFDSKESADKDGGNPVAASLRKMVGARIKMITDANGKVQSVEGVKELQARLGGDDAAGGAGMLKDLLSEENIKQMSPLTQGLPDKAVKVGDTWPVKVSASQGSLGDITMDMQYVFKGWEQHDNRKCALLEFTGSITSKGGGAEVKFDKGGISGKSWYDPAMGMTVDTASKQDITMMVNTPGQAMPTQVRQAMNAKLIEVADAAK